MFCGNCGSEIQDGLEICSKCGKSPSGTVVVNQQHQGNGYPLSNLTAKLFSVLFEIILWIILIGGVVVGGIRGNGGVGVFTGILIGGIASFVIIIFTGGLVSLFIKLVNNTDVIKNK